MGPKGFSPPLLRNFFFLLFLSFLSVVAYKLGEEQFIEADELALIFDVEFNKLRVLIPSEEEQQPLSLTKNLREGILISALRFLIQVDYEHNKLR